MTTAIGAFAGFALIAGCACIVALIIKRADHNNALARERKLTLAAAEAAKPMPTDLELVRSWMEELAKKIDADARSRQSAFQWFLFVLPFLYAVTYGLAWFVLYMAAH